MFYIKHKIEDFFFVDQEGILFSDWMRLLAAVLLVFTIIEFSVGMYVFMYLKYIHWGSWWAALFSMSVCVFGLHSANRKVVFACIILSIVSLCWIAAAVVVDGIGWSQFEILEGCYNVETGKGVGNINCKTSYDDDTGNAPQCVCSDGYFCHTFTLMRGNDCTGIITTYKDSLATSFALSFCLLALVFALALVSCFSVCWNPPEADDDRSPLNGNAGHFPRIEMSMMMVESPMIPLDELDGTEVEAIIDSISTADGRFLD